MKQSSYCVDEKAAKGIEMLSKALGVSRAEVVRRCAVAMHKAHKSNALPGVVEEGYGKGADGRKKRDAVGFAGSMGRAPDLGDLPDGGSAETAEVGMDQPTESSPSGDQSGSDDQDGENRSILDKPLW